MLCPLASAPLFIFVLATKNSGIGGDDDDVEKTFALVNTKMYKCSGSQRLVEGAVQQKLSYWKLSCFWSDRKEISACAARTQ